MFELKSLTYEQARAEHFKELMKKEQRKIDWWQAKARNALGPVSILSRSHIECSEAGMRYSYYNDALEALENQPKWISVDERLPEESGSYLVCTRRSYAFTAHFYLNTNEWKSHFAGSAGKHITHWMPLPEPPKEG